ncbi:YrrS family protein [Falsibacillus pallidus]|uniref:Uncharacterized protein DUF1510 n=1 Tax=Falsibacillus pallidus TaxID=493781 RepID=A0A370GJW9_9BACI|nr:YrrS family protein [Falsibacillus pallidus]RDI44078.1 uncharacterized protein DUF1510 [Falsibacillus pallidus]
MPKDYNSFGGSRSSQRAKRRKTNIILNSLIILVIILILVVGSKIFLGGKDPVKEQGASQHEPKTTEPSGSESDDSSQNNSEDANSDQSNTDESGDKNADSSDENKQQDTQEEQPAADLGEANEVPDDSNDPNVAKTYENPDWSPVGTSQSGDHVSSYDEGTPDWNEKVKALSYATGIPQDNMTVWFIGNGGSPDSSVGTVASKDQTQKYRVFLQWVDGEGWKPTKVQELKSLQ